MAYLLDLTFVLDREVSPDPEDPMVVAIGKEMKKVRIPSMRRSLVPRVPVDLLVFSLLGVQGGIHVLAKFRYMDDAFEWAKRAQAHLAALGSSDPDEDEDDDGPYFVFDIVSLEMKVSVVPDPVKCVVKGCSGTQKNNDTIAISVNGWCAFEVPVCGDHTEYGAWHALSIKSVELA